MLREQRTFDGDEVVASTVNDPWRSSVTADDGDLEARFVKVGATREHTALESGGWRTAETTYSFDEYGRTVEANDRGDVSAAHDDLCTRTDYATNTSAWILDTVRRAETVSVACGASPSRPADVVSDARYSYDGQAYGAAPSRGHVTRTQVLEGWAGGPVYVTTGETAYDAHGRVTTATDALGRETATAYTPAAGGPVTQVATTNPAGHVTTSVLDPLRGVPTRVTDANGRHIDATYDPLGRLTAVWRTDRDKASQSPSVEYDYRLSRDEPAAVTTRSLLPDGSYAESVALFDALLRPAQTQRPAAGEGGGRIVTMTEYDTRGLATVVKGPFHAAGDPSVSLVAPNGSVEREVLSTFDGTGRVTLERLLMHNAEHSRPVTAYGGDRAHVTPPDGGTATTTITDARGNVSEVRHYHGPTPDGAYDAMSYGYTPAGQLASVTDGAGNVWAYEYDLRGRRVATDDPDAGVSATVYDEASQVVETTDARGETLRYVYDALGRKIETRDGDGVLLSRWVYDSLEKGLLTSSTAYVDGEAYVSAVTGYDAGYRPLGSTITIPESEGALAGAYTVRNAWNPDGSPGRVAYEGHAGLPTEVVHHEYDRAGYPEWMRGARTYVADTVYSPFGEVERLALGADYLRGVWQTFDYQDGTRRLSAMSVDREARDPSDVQVAYSYDPAGNPVKIADTGAAAGLGDVQCFGYDHHRRLVGAWSQTAATCAADAASATIGGPAPYGQSFTYDDAGNRATMVDHADGVTTTYAYPGVGQPGPHTLTSLSTTAGETVSFGYDAAGNTLTADSSESGADQVYGWNSLGRIETAETGQGVSEFVYSAGGDRLIRRTPEATTLYVHGDELALDHVTGEVTGQRYYTFGGKAVAVRDSKTGELHTLAADLWGTPTVAVDNATGQISTRHTDPFGAFRDPQPVEAWPGDRGWHTGTHNKATGLIHMGARMYDPTIGRFLSVDPLMDPFDPDQVGGYAYANNNPLAFTDPSGLLPRLNTIEGVGAPRGDGKPVASSTARLGPPSPEDQLEEQVSVIQSRVGLWVINDPAAPTGPSEIAAPFTPEFWAQEFEGGSFDSLSYRGQQQVLDALWCANNPHACAEWHAAVNQQFADFALALTGVPDIVDCANASASGCLWAAAGLIGAGKIAKLADNITHAASTAARVEPEADQQLYRVYGGDSTAGGASWSPVDPRSVGNYRDTAGLPSGGASGASNTGQFVIEGTLNDPAAVVLQRSALPLDGMKGGLPDYIIPNWLENGSITINRVSGANPEF